MRPRCVAPRARAARRRALDGRPASIVPASRDVDAASPLEHPRIPQSASSTASALIVVARLHGRRLVGQVRQRPVAVHRAARTAARACAPAATAVERHVSRRRCSRSSTTSTRCSNTASSTVRRALAKAGDLAHGLKTPLAVLAHEAAVADAAGQHELAATIGEQVERMRRQVDYHLAHARAAASGATPGARCTVARVGRRPGPHAAPAARRARHRRSASTSIRDHAVRVQREDLDEMLGNLLDNACKWARSRVIVCSASAGGRRSRSPSTTTARGCRASMREAVLQRGMRADEAAPGSGLGLAIVQRARRAVRRRPFLSIPLRAAVSGRQLRLPANSVTIRLRM